MGDVFQVLRGLPEVPSEPAGDGAFPQALVLGGLGQQLGIQRLVHAEAEPQQNRAPVRRPAGRGGEAEDGPAFWGKERRRSGRRRCARRR